MNHSKSSLTRPSKQQWWRCLQAADPAAVQQLATRLTQTMTVEDVQAPESGLGLLQVQDGALGDRYFLGEFPLARAQVRLYQAEQLVAEGAALLLDDRRAQARAIAILDAMLTSDLPGSLEIVALMASGSESLAQQKAERQAILQKTKVDFSLLGQEE